MNFKKFSELDCTEHLTSKAKSVLDKWQTTGEDGYYFNLVINSLSSLRTMVTTNMPETTIHRKSYKSVNMKSRIKSERFDKLIERVRMSVKSKMKELEEKKVRKRPAQNRLFKIPDHISKTISTKVDPRKVNIRALRGNGQITSQFHPNGGAASGSTYIKSFEGKQSSSKIKNCKEYFVTSRVGGGIIPDPNIMMTTGSKIQYFKKQLKSFDMLREKRSTLNNLRSMRMSFNNSNAASNKGSPRRTLQTFY